MASTHKFLLLLLRIGSFLVAASPLKEQKFAMEPQDQTAVVGSRVTLPCRVIDKSGILQWTKDDFGLGTHRNLSGFDRYSMIGSDEEGEFSLIITPKISPLYRVLHFRCKKKTDTSLKSIKGFCAARTELMNFPGFLAQEVCQNN